MPEGMGSEFEALGDTNVSDLYAGYEAEAAAYPASIGFKPVRRISTAKVAAGPEVVGLDELLRNIEEWWQRRVQAARRASETIAQYLEQYAITHHLWRVQTGATNITTRGTWEELQNELFNIYLSADMYYDVYLELARDGKFAWLWPAVIENRDFIMTTVRGFMESA